MKLKHLLILLVITLGVIIGPNVSAQSVSGSTYWYIQQGSTSGMPSGYLPSHSVSTTFPTNTYQTIPPIDTNNQLYYGIKQIYLNPQNYTFSQGNSYKITIVFDKGSYLLGSSSLLGYTNNRALSYCGATGSSNDLTTCNIEWVENSAERWTATIYYTPKVTSNSAYFQIGNTGTSGNVFLFNNYTGYQGLRISTFNVDLDSSGTSAIINNNNQNTQNIMNNINENTQSINDNNNQNYEDFTDDELGNPISSGGGGGTYFDDINGSSDTPISDLLLLPVNLYTAILDNLSSVCKSYTIPWDFNGGNNTLTFPCINLQNLLGSELWSLIDDLFCLFMIYNIFTLIISTYDHITNLDDLFDVFHGNGYVTGKHEEGNWSPRHYGGEGE